MTRSEALQRLQVCRDNQPDERQVVVAGDIVDALLAPQMCSTSVHENQPAARYVHIEDTGAHPYCAECADLLIRMGALDGGPV